jgi:hypothetical protein
MTKCSGIDRMSAYQEYVERLRQRKPSLSNLCQFLSVASSDQDPCRVVCLDFFEHRKAPIPTDLDYDGLYLALKDWNAEGLEGTEFDIESGVGDDTWNKRGHFQGRILLIEDIDKRTVECLGSRLNIDPLFFAGHIHTPWARSEAQVPEQCILPSQSGRQPYANIHHHRTVVFDKDPPAKKLLRRANIERKVVISPLPKNQHVGIMQHCTSVLLSKHKTRWLGMCRKARCEGIMLTSCRSYTGRSPNRRPVLL